MSADCGFIFGLGWSKQNEMPKFPNKIAVVTGASKGLGASIAKHLAAEGAKVVVNYATSAAGAEKVVNEIKAAGGDAVAVRGDMTNAADVKGLFDATEAAFGLADILVNNAGVYGMSPLGTIDEASYRRYFDISVLGLMLATQEAAGRFQGKQGVIINISSAVSLTPGPGMSIFRRLRRRWIT